MVKEMPEIAIKANDPKFSQKTLHCYILLSYLEYLSSVFEGRGRDEDSEYLVIGEKGGGIVEREMANKIRENMMAKAVKDIQVGVYQYTHSGKQSCV